MEDVRRGKRPSQTKKDDKTRTQRGECHKFSLRLISLTKRSWLYSFYFMNFIKDLYLVPIYCYDWACYERNNNFISAPIFFFLYFYDTKSMHPLPSFLMMMPTFPEILQINVLEL